MPPTISDAQYGIRIRGSIQPNAAYTAAIVDTQVTATTTLNEIESGHIVNY